jgi:hypothetical protein
MKNYKLFTFILLMLASLQLFAQNKQERKVNTFKKIKIQSAIEAHISQGSTFSVTIETDNQSLDKIITEVVGDELIIKRQENWNWNWRNSSSVIAYITLPELTGLDVSGASNVKGETSFKSGKFDLDVSGASTVRLDLTTNEFKGDLSGASRTYLNLTASEIEAELSGASRLELKGKAEHEDIDLSGASRYEAFELESKKVKVEASGASTAELSVSEEILADVSGGSNLRYKGNPKRSETNASGGGSVRKVNY